MSENNDRIKIKYFVGNTRTSEWSSVYFYSPHIPATFEEKGEIFATVALSGPPSFDSNRAGNMLLDVFHETYFESPQKSLLDALVDAVSASKNRLLELLKHDDISAESGIEFAISTVAIHKNTAFACNVGDAKIFAIRDGEIADITSGLVDPDGRSQIKRGSFAVQHDDRFGLFSPEADFEVKEREKLKMLREFSIQALQAKYLANEALVASMIIGVDIESEHTSPVFEPQVEIQNPVASQEHSQNSAQTELPQLQEDEVFEEKILTSENPDDEYNTIVEKQVEPVTPVPSKSIEIQKPNEQEDEGVNMSDRFGQFAQNIKNLKQNRNAKTAQVAFAKFMDLVLTYSHKAYIFVKDDILLMGEKGRKVYIRGGQTRNWRPIVFFGVIFVVLIYIVVAYAGNRAEFNKSITEANQILSDVEKGINDLDKKVFQIKSDEIQAASDELEGYRSKLDGIKVEDEDITKRTNDLKSKSDTLKDKVKRNIKIEDLNTLRDFSGSDEVTDIKDIEIANGTLYLPDSGENKIRSLEIGSGAVSNVGEDLKGPYTVSYSSTQNHLVFVDEDDSKALGVIDFKDENKTKRVPGLSTNQLKPISNIDAYNVSSGDDRVYAARTDSKEVIQMEKKTTTYALPALRVSKNGGPAINFTSGDLNVLKDIEVSNGRIYVISEGQGLRQFFVNDEVAIKVDGLLANDTLTNVHCLHVDDNYIYLCDNQNKRVVVLKKSVSDDFSRLRYVAQFDLSKHPEADKQKDIVSSADRLYLLVDQEIVVFEKSQFRVYD